MHTGIVIFPGIDREREMPIALERAGSKPCRVAVNRRSPEADSLSASPARHWLSYVFLLLALAALFQGVTAGEAQAVTIISEDFNRPDNTNVEGATPDLADLPGGVFVGNIQNWSAQTEGNQLKFGADVSISIGLGAYDTGTLTLSADVTLGNLQGSYSTINRGVGLGFNSSSTGLSQDFTGLRLSPDGYLVFQSNNANIATVAVATSSSIQYLLSYTVDVNTGVLSAISLQGVTADFSPLVTASQNQDYFTGANTPYASVLAGGSAGGQFGYVDNLMISNTASEAVPEPVSALMLVSSMVGLGFVRRQRRAR